MAFPTPPHLHHRSRSFPDSPLLVDIIADENQVLQGHSMINGSPTLTVGERTPVPPKKRQRLVRSITFQVDLDNLDHHNLTGKPDGPQAHTFNNQDYFSSRPPLRSRQSSHSKRSASSNSPREVPLPAPRSVQAANPTHPMSSPVRISSPLVRRRPVSRQHIQDEDKMVLDDDHVFPDPFSPPSAPIVDSPSPPPSSASSESSMSTPLSQFNRALTPATTTSSAASTSASASAPIASSRSPIAGRPHSEIIHAPTPVRPSSVTSLPSSMQTSFQHLPRDPPGLAGTASSPPLFDGESWDDLLTPSAVPTRGSSYVSAFRRTLSPPPPPVLARTTSPTPTPPTILTPPPLPSQPFLSQAPPPPDSWIVVDTTPSEYRLTVSLPGFSRDAITMSVRRRRVLHVVADRWEGSNGAGHFERRIAFGWDADLNFVRADFEVTTGLLRVHVPRRRDQGGWWTAGLG